MNKPETIPLEYEIRKLGLTEKEAKIYMACLKLGKTSVQSVAKKVALSRPTVYRLIESLEKKELINKSKKKGDHFVIPESPDTILGMLRAKKRRIEEQEREFIRIIAILKAKYFNSNENKIKIYTGSEGRKFLLEDLSDTHRQDILIASNKESNLEQKKLEEIFEKIKKRLGSLSVKKINLEKISGTLIISDKIMYFQKNEAFVIEQENIVELLRIITASV